LMVPVFLPDTNDIQSWSLADMLTSAGYVHLIKAGTRSTVRRRIRPGPPVMRERHSLVLLRSGSRD